MHGDPDENLINNGGQLIFGVKVFFSKLQGITKILNFLWFLKKRVYANYSILFWDKIKSNTQKGPSSKSLLISEDF